MTSITPFPAADLPTPALVIERDALDRNIARMAAFAADAGITLRPHAKTHKSAEIARRQLAAGAVGMCCAKLGEAEALAAEGIDDIHLTSPVVSPGGIARLMRLNAAMTTLSVVADHPDNVVQLGAGAAAADKPLAVFVDVDPGNRRTGVASADTAVTLARAIGERDGLSLAGVQFYCGAQQHIHGFADRQAAIAERTAYLLAVLEAFAAAGISVRTVTGGGTGSFAIDAELGVLTELQVGSYVFLDREYDECELLPNGAHVFEGALSIAATVVSANADDRVTIDAGLKAMATEAGPPRVLAGAPPGSRFVFTGDEHGAIMLTGAERPALAERVMLMPPHCDPTVNLYDIYHVRDGGMIVEVWPVTARGRSS